MKSYDDCKNTASPQPTAEGFFFDLYGIHCRTHVVEDQRGSQGPAAKRGRLGDHRQAVAKIQQKKKDFTPITREPVNQ